MLLAHLAPQDQQLPQDASKLNEDMRQSGALSSAMWAGVRHEFLLLCSQALRFYGENFTVEMLPVIAYKKRELGKFFTLLLLSRFSESFSVIWNSLSSRQLKAPFHLSTDKM